jgi:Acyl-CoA dehydrogenase, C-terminal domain
MRHSPIIISLPIADRRTSFVFYRDGLGLDPVGDPADDGVPEPLQFDLNEGVRIMLVPTGGSSIFKLYWSEHHRVVNELAVDILGADAMTPTGRWPMTAFQADQPGAPNDSASWVGSFYVARAGTIYAGTSQVQRNIIGEMVLGLPTEPGSPRGTWRELQQQKM